MLTRRRRKGTVNMQWHLLHAGLPKCLHTPLPSILVTVLWEIRFTEQETGHRQGKSLTQVPTWWRQNHSSFRWMPPFLCIVLPPPRLMHSTFRRNFVKLKFSLFYMKVSRPCVLYLLVLFFFLNSAEYLLKYFIAYPRINTVKELSKH